MGSSDRSKKRIQQWKKALLHFSLCFIMGFFTGFAPTNTPSFLSGGISKFRYIESRRFLPQSIDNAQKIIEDESSNRSLMAKISLSDLSEERPLHQEQEESVEEPNLIPRKQLIIITTIQSNNHFQNLLLTNLANTLKLVPSPLLWIVVEPETNSSRLTDILRKTGVMYRYLVYKENFTAWHLEIEHQRNVALNHIENHKLDGIVHFAGIFNTYDLQFFESLREIQTFGTWPVALLSANRKSVVVEGPVCHHSASLEWHPINNTNNQTSRESQIHVSGFAFNSSILWDAERWEWVSEIRNVSQNPIKFIQQVILKDDTKLKWSTEKYTKIMIWNLSWETPSSTQGI